MGGRFLPMLWGAACLLAAGCADDSRGASADGGPRKATGCPTVTSWAISPLVTSVGGRVNLAAAVANADAESGGNVRWGGIRGRIAAPSPVTTFTCLTGGNQAITLTSTVAGCESVAKSFSVFCVPPKCGDGHLDPGEQCDPPNGTTCLAGCSLPCGDGIIEAGEDCDPPDGTTCSATCRFL
jgi:hypothetical protein